MQKNQVKLRNHSVDLVKCIAALLVVSVHADAFSEMSPVLENIINGAFGRMAVPFFACVTGYYLTKYTEQNGRAWLNNVKSLLKYYILLSVIYVIWSSLSNQFQEMSVAVIVYTVVKRFVIYGTYYHLWFFPAMILSVIVLHLSIRWHKERLCWMLCLLGVIFGALTYNWHHLISWEQLPVLGRMMGWYDFDYIRRFITLIGPFTFLGNFIFRHKDQWMEKYQTKTFSKAVTVLMIVGLLVNVFEIQMADRLGMSEGTTVSFSLIFVILFLFLFLLLHPSDTECMKMAGYFGGCASVILYGFHPLILEIIGRLMNGSPTMMWGITSFFLCVMTWGWLQANRLHKQEKR